MRSPNGCRSCPHFAGPSFQAGERTDDPLQMYLAGYIYSLQDHCGGTPGSRALRQERWGLPVGLKSSGSAFGSRRVCYKLADAFEQAGGLPSESLPFAQVNRASPRDH